MSAKTAKSGRTVAKLRKVAGLTDQVQSQNQMFRTTLVRVQALILRHLGTDLLPESERQSYLGVAYLAAESAIREPTIP